METTLSAVEEVMTSLMEAKVMTGFLEMSLMARVLVVLTGFLAALAVTLSMEEQEMTTLMALLAMTDSMAPPVVTNSMEVQEMTALMAAVI
jgi:hypothetical protein